MLYYDIIAFILIYLLFFAADLGYFDIFIRNSVQCPILPLPMLPHNMALVSFIHEKRYYEKVYWLRST